MMVNGYIYKFIKNIELILLCRILIKICVLYFIIIFRNKFYFFLFEEIKVYV